MVSFCGLICSTCPFHLATLEQFESVRREMRESIARLCSEQYGMNLAAGDITDCDGCPVIGGRLFSGCSDCKVRECALSRNVRNCSNCPDYACKILTIHFEHEPESRKNLEEIRKNNTGFP